MSCRIGTGQVIGYEIYPVGAEYLPGLAMDDH
jgi:hypothetical protein